MAGQSEWMTISEACEYLKISQRTLYRYMEDGSLPFFTVGETGHRRLKRSDLEALMIEQTRKTDGETST